MKMILTSLLVLLLSQVTVAQKKVLVEVMTNSHCPLCPSAHSTLSNYLKTPGNSEKIIPVFLHMPFPYNDDQLYKDNTADAAQRSSYYGITSSTPRGFFNGSLQSNSYANWATTLNSLSSATPVLQISVSGKIESGQLHASAVVKRTGSFAETDLVVMIMLVENVGYSGRNGITTHTNVVRRILEPQGTSINLNQTGDQTTVNQSVNWDSKWIADSTTLVAFVQSKAGKTILQSEQIRYPFLVATGVRDPAAEQPERVGLISSYPNPFNPSTTITWQKPTAGPISIRVFNVLGQPVAWLLNSPDLPAGSGTIQWNASGNPSGLYLIRMQTPAGSVVVNSLLTR